MELSPMIHFIHAFICSCFLDQTKCVQFLKYNACKNIDNYNVVNANKHAKMLQRISLQNVLNSNVFQLVRPKSSKFYNVSNLGIIYDIYIPSLLDILMNPQARSSILRKF